MATGAQAFEAGGALEAVAFAGPSGSVLVANYYAYVPGVVSLFLPAEETTAETVQPLPDLTPGAIVNAATVTVTAATAGRTFVGDVAAVRAAEGQPTAASDELVIDFGGLRTVSEVGAPLGAGIVSVSPWQGTRFGYPVFSDAGGVSVASFTEIQAERLLVVLDEPLDPDELGTGTVVMPTPPADLEVTVNGVRAWFAGGPARPTVEAAAGRPARFEATADILEPLRAAVARGPFPVELRLRSSVPGVLGLGASVDFLKTHAAVPAGATVAVEAPEEGVVEVPLALPPEAAGWQVRRVDATVRAAVGPGRVLPPVGPVLSGAAVVVLDPDHGVAVRLPSGRTGRLGTLTGVRLPLVAMPGGAEVRAVLHTDEGAGEPGPPVPGAQLGPATVEAGDGTAPPRWTTLALSQPHELGAGDSVWAVVQVARGRVGWSLAEPAVPADMALDAAVRRPTPSGRYRPLSPVPGVPTGTGAVRVAGEAPRTAPLPAVEAGVVGDTAAVTFTPVADGRTVSLALDAPAVPVGEPPVVTLRLTTMAPATFTLGPVVVAYTEGST